ncbi:hypothetical protein AWR38_00985 [Idiomarina sp. WRN-38]|jgi:hypothetical protein|nr:hypothetical protein AUR68_00980 [Idiomarina sp. H105]OAE96001.1 hypothetical protein AWR38_00985 [Idiomarina sp. WRN-38]
MKPITNSDAASRLLNKIIYSDGDYPEFVFKRAFEEISKIPSAVEKQVCFTMLYAAIGEQDEAEAQARLIPLPLKTYKDHIDAACAYNATNQFLDASRALSGIPIKTLIAMGDARIALQLAFSTFSAKCAEEIMNNASGVDDVIKEFHGSAALFKLLKKYSIAEDHVKAYVEECAQAIKPWLAGKNKPLAVWHSVEDDEDMAVVDFYLPAEPEEFGEILLAIASIDKMKYSPALAHRFMVDPQLYEDMPQS